MNPKMTTTHIVWFISDIFKKLTCIHDKLRVRKGEIIFKPFEKLLSLNVLLSLFLLQTGLVTTQRTLPALPHPTAEGLPVSGKGFDFSVCLAVCSSVD